MINSMTGFARQEDTGTFGSITWEIRSINHRYLDLNLRLPEAFNNLEEKMRAMLNKVMTRGRLDCTLTYKASVGKQGSIIINSDLIQQLAEISDTVRERIKDVVPMNINEILRWPGIMKLDETQLENIQAAILTSLENCIVKLLESRRREGESLKKLIVQRLDNIDVEINKIKKLLPQLMENIRDKLKQQFSELAVECNPDRLEQEMLLLVHKADVEEELDRLHMHIQEVRRILTQGDSIGRRLDFLMQELNREANTIGSKSIAAVITNSVVEIKVLIEQMREQIQNIE